jgi:hypothetical protein
MIESTILLKLAASAGIATDSELLNLKGSAEISGD